MKRFLLRLICLAGFFLLPGIAYAAVPSCDFTVTDLVFSGDPAGSVPDSSMTVTARCTNDWVDRPVTRICLILGNGTGGAQGGKRQMVNETGNKLNFQIYGYNSQVIGDPREGGKALEIIVTTSGGGCFLVFCSGQQTGTGTATLTGHIDLKQPAAPGIYTSRFSSWDADFYYGWENIMTDCNRGTFDPRSDAGDRTKSFEVRLPVARTCSVATTAVDFGIRSDLEAELKAEGNISVTCNFPGAYNVSLGSGNNAGGSGSRRMKLRNGTQTIPYQLFDKNNQPWGDDVLFGKKVKSDSTGQVQTLGKGGTDTLTVVGKVPAQQGAKPSAGTYEDSVVVTLTY